VTFATHALSPARISRVAILDAMERHMEVIVDDTQLSLAIGKKGQNVRLAAKLLGWRVDIKSEEEKRHEVETAMAALVVPGAPVAVLVDYGVPEELTERLLQAGIPTVEKLGAMTAEELEAAASVDAGELETVQAAVHSYYAQFELPPDSSPPGGEADREAFEQTANAGSEDSVSEVAVETPEQQAVSEIGPTPESGVTADSEESDRMRNPD